MIEPIKRSAIVKRGGEKILPPRIVVLGIGNLLLSDEGVGVHVANELMKMNVPPGVSVVEGGTDGFGLLNIITEADRLIVIDAVKGLLLRDPSIVLTLAKCEIVHLVLKHRFTRLGS